MIFTEFSMAHIEPATRMAQAAYDAQRAVVALPELRVPDLRPFAQNHLGVAALENDEIVGFLCAQGPFRHAFGTTKAKGVWAPAHAHAAAGDRGRVYHRMYQAAAEKWVAAGALSHAVTLYAHDEAAKQAWFTYGFGMRCVDAVKALEADAAVPKGLFFELPHGIAGAAYALNNTLLNFAFAQSVQRKPSSAQTRELEKLLFSRPRREMEDLLYLELKPLQKALEAHMASSPCFLRRRPAFDFPDTRIFGLRRKGSLAAYLKIRGGGESFACDAPEMMNVCGAYAEPELRGTGLFDSLLRYAESVLVKEGYTLLGVDFESFNPTALRFWGKRFTAYAHTVARRIDERGN
jgi:GNAT superfamily N-acetyltransferase